MYLEEEEWRDIKGFEGLYQVSNLGNVKRLKSYWCKKERIVKQSPNNQGYLRLTLCKNNVKYPKRVHRLVAEAFLPNPDNLPQVNHKDENKLNNRVDNLEWCTAQYNINYGTCVQRTAEKNRIKVNQYTKNMEFIREWHSITDAAHSFNAKCGNISKCCKHRLPQAYGYIWRYIDDPTQYIDQPLF